MLEGVTPLSRGLFTPKKGAEEEVKRDPAREMAQLTVAAFGGQDNARKYFGTTLPVTPNDYSDLDPWREAALRSAEDRASKARQRYHTVPRPRRMLKDVTLQETLLRVINLLNTRHHPA